ncbi:MAG: amidohydrolase family protein, partial [Proteobacteria bacterium]|nr:amidohydrolase family protein [Pseudomonadota bacterium]
MKKKNLFNTILTITALAVVMALPQAQAQEEKEPNQILITNVNVWDGRSDAVKKGVDVLVEGNKIKKIGKIDAPKAVKVDGQGGTVTPGLIDMHQHLMLNGGTAAGNNWD